ncbi:MAG: PAS domain-containing sensor histidine kinase [bacterium]|nr:PAS domain-containing sensor histidine kinase [bacterium]MDP3963770.1 PAS domain-containing sensor histidine kinase [bacterium]
MADAYTKDETKSVFDAPRAFVWAILFVFTALAGVAATLLIGRYAENHARKDLVARAESIAAGIDKNDLEELGGTEADLALPAYQNLKSKMTRIRQANPDARFVYLVGYRDAYLFIFVDSEPPESEDYSPPGDIYAEASDFKVGSYLGGESFSEGPYVDRWGEWVSGYAPIFDQDTGRVMASAALDIDAKYWRQELWYVRALPASVTVLALIILWILYRHRKEEALYIKRIRIEEDKLAASESRFRSFMEQAPYGVAIFAPDGLLTFANYAWRSLRPSQVAGGSAYNIRHDRQLVDAGIAPLIEKAFARNTVHTPVFFFSDSAKTLKAGSGRWVQAIFYAAKAVSQNSNEIVAVFTDMTELKEAQEKSLNLEERTREEFVSMASHQLRTPLTTIQGYADMLLVDDAGVISEKQRDFIREIQVANHRMLDLINAFLNASRVDMGMFAIEPQLVNAFDIIEAQLSVFSHDIEEKGLVIQKDFDPVLEKLHLDPKLTGIVMQCLLSNAVRYSRKGGAIRISIKKTPSDFYISVSDDGIGIPLLQQNKIFLKVFRADNAAVIDPNGSGLDLYIVKAIVEAAGGTIRFESKEGRGATFYITLPLEGMKRREGIKGLT